jgi:hypothetical protein
MARGILTMRDQTITMILAFRSKIGAPGNQFL